MQPQFEQQFPQDSSRLPAAPRTEVALSSEQSRSSDRGEGLQPQDIPPYVFSQPVILSNGMLFSENHSGIRSYVFNWIRHPDEGSAFDKATKYVRWLPDRALFGLLRAFSYDGILFTRPGEVVAHVFFQRHGSALHMFSVSVAEAFRGQGLAHRALDAFVEYARSRPGVDRVRLGAGGHPAVRAICQALTEHQHERKVLPEGNGFFRFCR